MTAQSANYAAPMPLPPFYALAVAVLAALAPGLLALPLWHTALIITPVLGRIWLGHRNAALPHLVVRIGWALLLFAFAFMQYHTLVGREGGVAVLSSLIAVKFLETKNHRDVRVLSLLAFFACSTGFLVSQSPLMLVYTIVVVAMICGQLAAWHRDDGKVDMSDLRRVGRMLLEALPIALILFVLFPRLSGPLWHMPDNEPRVRTGLSDDMSPGSFSDLTQDDSVAFRVDFNGPTPPRSQMYWRGPVMSSFDGTTWHTGYAGDPTESFETAGPVYRYTMTLEPHQRTWLLALDLPVQLPENARLSPTLQALSRTPVTERQRFAFASSTHWRTQGDSERSLARNLAIPPNINPQARALAANWLRLPPAQRVAAAMRFLRDGHYQYTLAPPLLTSVNRIDQLLFETRAGFCEHYAGAFTFLMRAAGVPARVVGGYLGGEYNRTGNYWIVRQASAHAWSEVWLPGQGWQRVDPTSMVAPDRINRGLAESVPSSDPLPFMLRDEDSTLAQLRLNWDAVMHGWDTWVVGYDAQRQMQVLNRLGIDNLLSPTFVGWLCGGFGVLLLIYLIAASDWRRARKIDAAQRHWQFFQKKLAKAGISARASEGPLDFARRAALKLPAQQGEIFAIASQYVAIRYGPTPDALPGLIRATRQFRVR
ncbi:transglutaminase TgpA family protein [Silvimonas soli]|uniref:transglutaminase TgpA family protein n=1 Tax=Silvimonas soli TaxID=2980100 RepID=UPI0024B36DF9|nr:DUF3488 and transglutaminase-like domain-containing protein [Silvimonas soli]